MAIISNRNKERIKALEHYETLTGEQQKIKDKEILEFIKSIDINKIINRLNEKFATVDIIHRYTDMEFEFWNGEGDDFQISFANTTIVESIEFISYFYGCQNENDFEEVLLDLASDYVEELHQSFLSVFDPHGYRFMYENEEDIIDEKACCVIEKDGEYLIAVGYEDYKCTFSSNIDDAITWDAYNHALLAIEEAPELHEIKSKLNILYVIKEIKVFDKIEVKNYELVEESKNNDNN